MSLNYSSSAVRYGHTTNMLHEHVAGIPPEDLSRHVYVLGSSGCGKSTLIRHIFKHAESANHAGTFPNSTIYIDVKDEDAKLFLSQCDRTSFDNDSVTYLDINNTNFGINLLELPKHQPSDRSMMVSRTVGYVMNMFKEFYSQPQTFVQFERILRLLLLYLYSNTDSPTMLDLYEIIVRLQRKGNSELTQILQFYKNVATPEMKNALSSVASLSKEAWISLLNRIEPFATDEYMRNKFSVKHTSIDFEKMLKPGNVTIFRISDTETPKNAHSLAIMAVVLKIWFTIQERASKMAQEKRSLVILALDEFQKIKELSILSSILSQARIYNLGLILSHQNLSQIDHELLETIIGNTATQIYGRVSGTDASRIAQIIDPHFSKELTDQIATQPDFVFTIKIRSLVERKNTLPLQFKAFPPLPVTISEKELLAFLKRMKSIYGANELIQSSFNSEENKKIEWMKQLYSEFRTKEEWEIICFLHDKEANLTKIVEATNSVNRNKTSMLLRNMIQEGLINIAKSIKRGSIVEHLYTVSTKTNELYFPKSFRLIGTAEDIDEVASKAIQYYVNNKMFISLAIQNVRNSNHTTDMIAYNYDTGTAISIEIESVSELSSHPEQTRHNMLKWKKLGFTECHVWSKSPKIQEIKDKLGTDAHDVRIFVV
ncbi:MAG: type IV secretion system DNA-binding domain-containing protein [Candidatus Nitrosotenuis sp.]